MRYLDGYYIRVKMKRITSNNYANISIYVSGAKCSGGEYSLLMRNVWVCTPISPLPLHLFEESLVWETLYKFGSETLL